MKGQFSFLNQIKNDLKKYQKVAKESTNSIDENLSKIPEKDKDFFVNLQNKINILQCKHPWLIGKPKLLMKKLR